MNYSNTPDDRRFTRMVRRDAVWLGLIMFVSFLFFFLAPFIAYLGQKYNF